MSQEGDELSIVGEADDQQGENTTTVTVTTPAYSNSDMTSSGMEVSGLTDHEREILVNTIEVSMEEVVTLGQLDSEEIEIICEETNMELNSEGSFRDNVMIVNSMPIHEIEVVETQESVDHQHGGQEEVSQATTSWTSELRRPCFKVVGETSIQNIANSIIIGDADIADVGGGGGNKSTKIIKQVGAESQGGTTHLIITGKNDVLLPVQSPSQKASLQNMTFTTIDGKTVKLKPLGSGINIPTSKTENDAVDNEASPEVQELNVELPPIITAATMAQQTLSAALNASNRTITVDPSSNAESTKKSQAKTITVEVPGGGSMELQKYYLQPGLCRVCLLAKEHLTPIFEDVNIDSNGMVENSRGSNAAHRFSLIAALKTLIDVEVKYQDGLPDMICLECYDELTNFSAYRKRIALAQNKLTVVLDQVKETQLPTFIPALGEVDIQKTGVYRNPASIVAAKKLLAHSQYSHLALRKLSDRIWDKIFLSFSTIVGYKSGKLKGLEAYVCEKPYVDGFFCHFCNSTVHGTKEDYALHYKEFHGVKSSTDVMYPCDICGNNFPMQEATSVFPVYYEHWLQHFFLHDCDICSKKLPSVKGVWVHKKSAHGNKEKTFNCTDCDKSFSKKPHLEAHLRTHIGDNSRKVNAINCTICGKEMSCNSTLTVHMNSVHATEKNWKCDLCNKRFTRKEVLVTHRASHTNVKKYQCETCGEAFTSQSYKVTHMLRHKGDKQFSCENCSKEFYTASELKGHMVTHETASHECDECGKAFKRLNYLVEHKKTHTGEKPNKCPVCGKEIRMRSNYFKHMRIHKRKNEIK